MSEDSEFHYYDENWGANWAALALTQQINEATKDWPHWVESLGTEVDLSRAAERIYKIDGVWYQYHMPSDSDFKKYSFGRSPTLAEFIQAGLFVQVDGPS